MSDTLGWAIPVASWASLLIWVAAFRAALPALRGERPMPLDARLAIWTAVLSVSLALALSSLTYNSLLPTEEARFVLLIGRIVLLVAGLVTWMETRR